MYETGKGIVGTYDKQILGPYGEYLPQLFSDFFSLFGGEAVIKSFEKFRPYEKGDGKLAVSAGLLKAGVLLCSEIVSPEMYRSLSNSGTEVFVNQASHGLFHSSKILFAQIQAVAQVRAAENGRPLIYASNLAPSFTLDSNGTVTGELGWSKIGVLYSEVYPENAKTPYTRIGSFVLLLPLGIVLAICYPRRKEK